MIRIPCFTMLFALTVCLNTLLADSYLTLPVTSLTLSEGRLPGGPSEPIQPGQGMRWERRRALRPFMRPYTVSSDHRVEMYLSFNEQDWQYNSSTPAALAATSLSVRIRADVPRPINGTLVFPRRDWSGMTRVAFTLPDATLAAADARRNYFRTKAAHYQRLWNRQIPGAAWFRHEMERAERELGGTEEEPAPDRRPNGDPPNGLRDSYHLFSGGRAVSENLQLDRQLLLQDEQAGRVDIEAIEGITTEAIDWTALIQDKDPELDATAQLIPLDQHALFFPSFTALTTLVDEAEAHGTPILQLLEPRSESAQTRDRYQRQLCLQLNAVTRALGPKVVRSIAITGSDPYLRTGSDLALIFDCSKPAALYAFVQASQAAAASKAGGKKMSGKAAGLTYTGVVSGNRQVSSYLAKTENFVIVTNSLAQLERIGNTLAGDNEALAGADEFSYFRDRYPLGDAKETAFLLLSDATIRRWCSPKWRIAAARRTRAAAVLSELQARWIEAQRQGKDAASTIAVPASWQTGGDTLTMTAEGPRSSRYGTLAFLTPIVELEIKRASEAEASAYNRFRNRYQRNWQQVFDPIALRFMIQETSLGADLTVLPVIANSEYRRFMDITGQTRLEPADGDPHSGTLLQYVMALDPNSGPARQAGNFLGMMAPNLGSKAINWVGGWATFYVDKDPVWQKLDQIAREKGENGVEEFMESNLLNLPIALGIDVKNAFTLSGFLASARAFIQQSAPNMLVWETRQYQDMSYVRVTPSEDGLRAMPGDMSDPSIFYLASPKILLISPSEALIKRAIDRTRTQPEKEEAPEWLGGSLALQAEAEVLTLLEQLFHDSLGATLQARSWGNLPILNEWRRRFGNTAPLNFHQKQWHTRLVCPAGGEYVWNEEFKTMESTATGCPAQPRPVKATLAPLQRITQGRFGLTFEDDGVRARVQIQRQTAD